MAEKTQWEKLQAIREANGAEPTPLIVKDAPAAAEAQPRNADGTFAPKEETPPAVAAAEVPPVETPPVEVKPEVTPPAAEVKPNAPAAAAPAPAPDGGVPQGVEVEIDGQKMLVAPDIAEAFQKAEKVKAENVKTEDRRKLKEELKAELKAEQPAGKSAEELAAEAAIAQAEKDATEFAMPSHELAISDPEKYTAQLAKHVDYKSRLAGEKAKAETLSKVREQQEALSKTGEQQAREILREQFYQAYPTLRGSEEVINPMLAKKFDEIVSSGILNEKTTPAEREELKKNTWAQIATQGATAIVKIAGAAKKVVSQPAAAPPNLAASAPVKPKVTKAEEPKAKEKYPPNSISAALAARRAKMERASA